MLSGPRAQKKKTMIAEGLLDKHGRPNERTPSDWSVTENKLTSSKSAGPAPATAAGGDEQAAAVAQSEAEPHKEHKKKKHAPPPIDTN